MIIMNMQNKLYTIQFSHHLINNSVSVPKQQSQNLEFANFAKFLKKTKLPEKLELLEKRRFELTEKRKKDSCSLANPHS